MYVQGSPDPLCVALWDLVIWEPVEENTHILVRVRKSIVPHPGMSCLLPESIKYDRLSVSLQIAFAFLTGHKVPFCPSPTISFCPGEKKYLYNRSTEHLESVHMQFPGFSVFLAE